MKQIFTFGLLAILLIFLAGAQSASATDATTTTNKDTKTTTSTDSSTSSDADMVTKKKAVDDALAAYKAAKETDKLAKAKEVVKKDIDRRIFLLTNFQTKVVTRRGLTADQISSLKSLAQTAIDGLTPLKAKVDTETTLDAVKADAKEMVSKYHVFMVLMPDLELTSALDQGQAALTKLKTFAPRLQKVIDDKKAAGVDVAALTTAQTDFNNQLTDAQKQLDAAKTELAKVTMDNADTSKTAIAAAKEDLKKFRADMVAARGDLNTIKASLESTKSTSTSSTDKSSSSSSTSSTETKTTTPASSSSGATSSTKTAQ